MRNILILISIFFVQLSFGQSLPINFESDITTSNFEDFDGGTATVIDNPQSLGINTSGKVAQIIRNGGAVWAGSKIQLVSNLDFSTNNSIKMKVFTSAPAGTVVKFKLEGSSSIERDVTTTTSGEWEELTWDFTGTPSDFNYVVFMFDFGNVGDGSASSTFLFDDVEQFFGGYQIDLPVSFENPDVNYTTTDFEGNQSSLVTDPEDSNNSVIKIFKSSTAGSSAGTTIGTPSGFLNNIPLTLSDSKMRVKVWSPDAGIPVRLKVEDHLDPTHTCETEATTTAAGSWEVLEFDFTNEASGTAALSYGLNMGWTYNMASIFFNFGTEGSAAGDKSYYFDNVEFGSRTVNVVNYKQSRIVIAPNPANNHWGISNLPSHSTITVVDLIGNVLYSKRITSPNLQVDANVFTPGIYLAVIESNNGKEIIRIVKN